jgi:acyl-coenzyme A synthetase/AMP-(fatty) acid ligase
VASLRERLSAVAPAQMPHLWALGGGLAFDVLASATSLGGRLPALHGRSALLVMRDQLATALALVELDGVVRRLVVCPPGLSPAHLAHVASGAGADAIVTDGEAPDLGAARIGLQVTGGRAVERAAAGVPRDQATEWVMLTSGTSGAPKLVVHDLASLIGAIGSAATPPRPMIWGTFYDIRRFGGLQILLRSLLCGASLVLSGGESMGAYLERAGRHGVTHISGTPSQWRGALAYPSAAAISPRYVRLSGEIADQAILDALRARYPEAALVHAFASTEAGVGFEVDDGQEGFPAHIVGSGGEADVAVREGSLRIRSARTASRYLGPDAPALADADGFVDTGDLVQRRGDRYYFVGRRDGAINVGGLKVHPEEVEAVINRHPEVLASLVRSRKNLITGAIVIADVVLRGGARDTETVRREILQACRQSLTAYKVPASIRFVAALDASATGKFSRQSA